MPDPRLLVGFEGIDGAYASFKYDGTTIIADLTQPGNVQAVALNKSVSLSAAATVQLAADADGIVGKIIGADPTGVAGEAFCTVQVEGFCSLGGGTAATLTLGTHIVGALLVAARGYIRSVNTAVAAEIGKQSAVIIDASDTTNVVVNF